MTLEEFNEFLDKLPKEDYIVTIASKHQLSDKWDIHNEILLFEVEGYADGPCFVWNDDWYEGQHYIIYLGITPVNKIIPMNIDKMTAEEFIRIWKQTGNLYKEFLEGRISHVDK